MQMNEGLQDLMMNRNESEKSRQAGIKKLPGKIS